MDKIRGCTCGLGLQNYVLSAHDDLVAAVDFTDQYLVTGHEDSTVGVWDITKRPMNSVRVMPGLLTYSKNARYKLYYYTGGGSKRPKNCVLHTKSMAPKAN